MRESLRLSRITILSTTDKRFSPFESRVYFKSTLLAEIHEQFPSRLRTGSHMLYAEH